MLYSFAQSTHVKVKSEVKNETTTREPRLEILSTAQPVQSILDPITFILIFPFLPFYLFTLMFLNMYQRRISVVQIERTPTGYIILEYER